jgi:serine/threonine protein kinase
MNWSTIFRYERKGDSPVATGGCGQLWLAHDRLLDEPVVIKTFRDEVAAKGAPRAFRSFELEAIAGARLGRECKHVVTVRDLGRTDSHVYLVMDHIPARCHGRADVSLLAGACSLARARRILLHAASAVEVAHRRGVVHSDIAPWNILFREADNTYLLADFGLLKIVERDLVSIPSQSLMSGGRTAFLPPALRNDFGAVSRSSDVYALAVTLWHLLEGPSVLRHTESIPGTILVRSEQRDAPYEVRALLSRFIENHATADDIGEFVRMLERIPTR